MFFMIMTSSYANTSIPFELINGIIIIEAEIDGKLGNYIVDSGSNGILLNAESIESNINYQTLTTTMEGSETVIRSFKVGEFEVRELSAFSTDLSNLESYLEKRINGILGCSIFTPHSLVFDFENANMIISSDELKVEDFKHYSSLSFKIIEDLPIVNLEIEGKKYAFILDSGASSHFIDSKIIDQNNKNITRTGQEKSIVTASGIGQVSSEYRFSNCIVGGEETELFAYEKDFSSISEVLGKEVSGLLSLSKLSHGKVYFDLKKNKFYYN